MFGGNEERAGYIKPGLRKEGCEIVEAKVVAPKGGDVNESVLEITFREKATKGLLTFKEWNPTLNKNGTSTPEQIENSIEYAQSRLTHIMNRYVEDSKYIVGNTWLEYINNVANFLNGNAKGIECAIKVTLRKATDGKYYSQLPKFPDFISTAKFPKEFTKTNYDMFEAPNQQPDQEAPANLANAIGTSTAETPF
jgi:hypothetical protein